MLSRSADHGGRVCVCRAGSRAVSRRGGRPCRGGGSAGSAGAASSRSLRAERRRRRRRRRRRGRCSRRGREPCQENTTSQLRPSMPAAQRSEARPPALLPPLGPHLGPIVCSARRRRREAAGGEEGSPALRSVREASPAKLFQFEHRIASPSPTVAGGSGEAERTRERAPEGGCASAAAEPRPHR